MSIILAVILTCILIYRIYAWFAKNKTRTESNVVFAFLCGFAVTLVIIGSFVGLFVPISGYEEPEVVYTVPYASFEDEEMNEVKYVETSEVYEAEVECSVARPKKSFWTLALTDAFVKTEYTVYVPMGTLAEYVS